MSSVSISHSKYFFCHIYTAMTVDFHSIFSCVGFWRLHFKKQHVIKRVAFFILYKGGIEVSKEGVVFGKFFKLFIGCACTCIACYFVEH